MEASPKTDRPARVAKRLSKAERRRQLLDTALLVVREEGADRLTLGHLAVRAGVSKPVVYDHFETRSELLIALYRWIDTQKVDAFREAMSASRHSGTETAGLLAAAYIQCAADIDGEFHADIDGEFHAVGAALAGSEEKAAVFQELLANSVAMFVAVLAPHSRLSSDELKRRCVGLVGAGEALAAAKLRGDCNEGEAIATLTGIIDGAVQRGEPS